MTKDDKEFMLEKAQFLENLADTIAGWRRQSIKGGWSTHQIEANGIAAVDCAFQALSIRQWVSDT